MRRLLPLLILLFMALGAMAQISVKSFQPLPQDMTASSLEYKKKDQNGDVAAIIKIVTSETGFAFEGGTLGILHSQPMTGEVWVWLPRASRKITIKHQKYGVLRDYRFPVEIEAERTYEMVLEITKGREGSDGVPVTNQYLGFQINPAKAMLTVNEEVWPVEEDGSSIQYKEFGTYNYRIEAANYHTEAGVIELNDPAEMQLVTVNLRPNYGWIEVSNEGNLRDATVFIDSDMLGTTPCKSDKLKSGKHTVRITKNMYEQYTEIIEVKDNEVTRIAPRLKANFSEVTLRVDADAEIWVNNQKKGVRTWTGALSSGTYKVECKMPSHETSQTTLNITPNLQDPEFVLPLPKPIYGSLNVESTPNFADIYIDGTPMGKTPKSIQEILIGTHEIKLVKDGFIDTKERVDITKGERKQLSVTLSSYDREKFNDYLSRADNAKNSGKFDIAIQYYDLASGIHQDPEIQQKVELVQYLKTGFDYVNTAIANKRYEDAESMIQKILLKDPGNSMAVDKSNQIKEQRRKDNEKEVKEKLGLADKAISNYNFEEARGYIKEVNRLDPGNPVAYEKTKLIEKKEKEKGSIERKRKWRRATAMFRGDDDKHDVFGGLHVEIGWNWMKYQMLSDWKGNGIHTNMAYSNYKTFPFTVDMNVDYSTNYTTLGLGLGSALTFGNHFALNYGGGYRWNWYTLEEVPIGRTGNFYYSVGATLMFDRQLGGISYAYQHTIGDDIFPASRHTVSYICGNTLSYYFAFLGVLAAGALLLGGEKK